MYLNLKKNVIFFIDPCVCKFSLDITKKKCNLYLFKEPKMQELKMKFGIFQIYLATI